MVERFTQRWPEWQAETNKSYPMGRIAQPEGTKYIKQPLIPTEIAEAVVFLCSPNCTFMTGEVMVIDGGKSCE